MPIDTTNDPVIARPVPADEVLAMLRRWAPGQRWFPAKGTAGELDRVAVVELTDPEGEAEVRLELLRLPSGGLLQVPVTLRSDSADGAGGDDGTDGAGGADGADVRMAVIGALGDGRLLVDGCHDPAFLRAWLAAAQRDRGSGTEAGATDVSGMRVLTGEQSNTSVLLPQARPPAILKVFRGLGTGPNPDVVVPLALTRAGWHGVPRPLAWLTGSWPAAEEGSAEEIGHLGVLSELVPDAQDGFELACRYAGDGQDFGDLAEDLGRTTAQMHQALRTALPVHPHAVHPHPGRGPDAAAPVAEATTVVGVLRTRAAAAVAAAPVLADRAGAIEEALSAVEQVEALPPLQRVHGDYHLGQVLRSPDRGWAVLDFEGEPQAAASERTRPDLALRDLAGMLRSLDYAAAVGQASSPDWVTGARARLVTGYLDESGEPAPRGRGGADPTTTDLLRALELDKALYEVVYESRNRPTWVNIPLDGVDRLLGTG